jgi:hypothetical protein
VVVTDSGSPAWAPDSSRVVYSERYSGRIYTLDIDNLTSTTVYDSAIAPPTVQDCRYNIEDPVFIDADRVLSASSYGGSLYGQDPWTQPLVTDTSSGATQPFPAYGAHPRVQWSTGEILLEATDGLRLVTEDGTEVRQYQNMYNGRWAPNGEGFAALEYPQYAGDNPRLVWVHSDGEVMRLEDLAFQPDWHPEGQGIAFVKPAGGQTYFDPFYQYGTIFYHDLATGESRPIVERARAPHFAAGSNLLFFETADGLGLSDLEKNRVLRDLQLQHPVVSPNGEYVAGVLTRGTPDPYNYGPNSELAIYTLLFD